MVLLGEWSGDHACKVIRCLCTYRRLIKLPTFLSSFTKEFVRYTILLPRNSSTRTIPSHNGLNNRITSFYLMLPKAPFYLVIARSTRPGKWVRQLGYFPHLVPDHQLV
jgi:hypothetical protein